MADEITIFISASGEPGEPQDSSPDGSRLGRFEAALEAEARKPAIGPNSAIVGHFGRALRHPDAPMSLEQYKAGVAGYVPGDPKMFAVRGYRSRGAAATSIQSLPGTLNEDSDPRVETFRKWMAITRGSGAIALAAPRMPSSRQSVSLTPTEQSYMRQLNNAALLSTLANDKLASSIGRIETLSLASTIRPYGDGISQETDRWLADNMFRLQSATRRSRVAIAQNLRLKIGLPRRDYSDPLALKGLAGRGRSGLERYQKTFETRVAESISRLTGVQGLSRLVADSAFSRTVFGAMIISQAAARVSSNLRAEADRKSSFYMNLSTSMYGDPTEWTNKALEAEDAPRRLSAVSGAPSGAVAGGFAGLLAANARGLVGAARAMNVVKGAGIGAVAVVAGQLIIGELVEKHYSGLRKIRSTWGADTLADMKISELDNVRIFLGNVKYEDLRKRTYLPQAWVDQGKPRVYLGNTPDGQAVIADQGDLLYGMAIRDSSGSLSGAAGDRSAPVKFGTGSYGESRSRISGFQAADMDKISDHVARRMALLEHGKVRKWR